MSGMNSIAYFIGTIQSDGCIYKFHNKKRGIEELRLRFRTGKKSLPMLQKVQEILDKEFKRKIKILYEGKSWCGTDIYTLNVNIKKLIKTFPLLKINKTDIPTWVSNDVKNFCAYLAGMIDGDGSVVIKRQKYPQCCVRIISGEKRLLLSKYIREYLKCRCWIEKSVRNLEYLPTAKRTIGNSFRHCFYVSSKNFSIFKKLVYPYIQIKHKRNLIKKYFSIAKKLQVRLLFKNLKFPYN